MGTAHLVLKQSRFEIVVLGGALVILALAILTVAVRLGIAAAQVEACYDAITCAAAEQARAQLDGLTVPIISAGVGLPILAGVVFGVPLVAREIERGTASLPWAMSRSRRDWFLPRLAVLGVTLACLTALPAIALEVWMRAVLPSVEFAHSYAYADARGPIVVARAVAAFSLGALCGALTGRVLPGLLLAIAASAALLAGLQLVDDSLLRADAVPLAADSAGVGQSLVFATGYDLTDGRIVDWETAVALINDANRAPEEVFSLRFIGVPANLAPEKAVREIGLILLASAACVGAAVLVVGRRRPY